MEKSYDVIVVGGGTAGVIAAIQSGRAGAKTLLVEKQGMLGGTVTTGGVNYPASFHARGEQIISGIGWELCCRVRRESGVPEPEADAGRRGGEFHFEVSIPVYAAICDEMLVESGVDLLLHTMVATVDKREQGWDLQLCGKEGLMSVEARQLVDCTGDANLVTMAGGDVVRHAELQPSTLVVRVSGYDQDQLDYESLQQAFDAEVAAGNMQKCDPGWGRGNIGFFLRGYGGNRIHIPFIDASTSEGKTQAELAGRNAMLRMLRFCRKQPGLENFKIDSCAPECGIRETVTIKGRETITIDRYRAGYVWDDAVCYAFYPIDIHRYDFIDYESLPDGCVPTIPLGALLPEKLDDIIVAGRCAAGDWASNSSYRVEASCMAMGQVAGAAAAMAAMKEQTTAELELSELKKLLETHGAIVPTQRESS